MEKDPNPASEPQNTHPVAQEHIDAVPAAVAGHHTDEGFEAEMMDVDGEGNEYEQANTPGTDITRRGSDIDSAMGSYATSTYTIGSSIAGEVVEENGRTYHTYKDGKYMLPNDENELNRLDMQHKMWSIQLDEKLHLAPIAPNPQNVLDIATGTGIWAIDFADAYPSARVIGTDLSLVQPQYVPQNLQFELSDAEEDEAWIFPQKFDYVHGRALASCFKDPLKVIKHAYSVLKPGGYLEFQDMTLQLAETPDDPFWKSSLYEWQSHVKAATAFTGVPWTNVPNYHRWFREAGFEDVTEVNYRWPSNQWSKNRKERLIGAWSTAQMKNGMMESVSTRLFMSKLGWSKEKLDEFLGRVKADFANPQIKAYTPIHIVWGRKPLSAS